MNIVRKYILVAAAIVALGSSAMAQDASQSSTVRRRSGNERDSKSSSQPGVTQRMESFYQNADGSDANLQWMKVIYRSLDLQKPKNAALYYPEDLVDGQENLFRMILRLLASNRIAAYEYLDGREIFNDQYRLNVRDMLQRFYIPYTEAKGSTEKNPQFTIDESDVPTNEVLSYYILERWEFDTRSNKMKTLVDAICPVLHRSGDFGGEAVRYPMFWVKLESLRPYMAQQSIFVDDDNNLARYTLDDFFAMNMYEGEIYKTRNLQNKSMMQLYPDPDDMKHAQDSIQHRLDTYGGNMWVPSREEVIAAREAREAVAAGDSVVIKDRDAAAKPAKATRSSRSAKQKKAKEPKQAKVSSSSAAVRSVRRHK
jgi:gliding motility associated protien GldN